MTPFEAGATAGGIMGFFVGMVVMAIAARLFLWKRSREQDWNNAHGLR